MSDSDIRVLIAAFEKAWIIKTSRISLRSSGLLAPRPSRRLDAASLDQPRQILRIGDHAHDQRLRASADRDLLLRRIVRCKADQGADVFRDDRLAAKALRHVLQPRGDVDGV